MVPRLPFRDTVKFYDTVKDAYGKDELQSADDIHTVSGLFVQRTDREHAQWQDSITSDAVLHLPPADTFILSRKFRLEGMAVLINPYEADDSKQFFRIVKVSVARDVLLRNAVRHVECSLKKISGVNDAS